MKIKQLFIAGLLITVLPFILSGQQGARDQKATDDITKCTNKTIIWVGPHQDDEAGCRGTLSLLRANGNKIIMLWYTTGNKGSRDMEMTSERLAQIRKIESEKASGEMGITLDADTFICFGYDDGMLEYIPEKELYICQVIQLTGSALYPANHV